MGAGDVIAAFEALPRDEQIRVAAYVRGLELSGDELEKLAEQFVVASTPQESRALEERIVNGFFGIAGSSDR